MALLVLLVWLVTMLGAFVRNKDIFSPAKLYLMWLFVFFAEVFFSEYSLPVYLCYLALLAAGVAMIMLECHIQDTGCDAASGYLPSQFPEATLAAVVAIWAISVIPLFAQLRLIMAMGGFQSYVNTLGLRVLLWRGLGHWVSLINVFPTVNLVYLVVMLTGRKKRRLWWLLYCVHSAMFVALGLLSGSRGVLLLNLMLVLMVLHYLRKRLPKRGAVLAALVMVLAGLALGHARQGYRLTDEGFRTGLVAAEQLLTTQAVGYGCRPLELVFSREPTSLTYGLTFATVFTNLVPRRLWPGKPDSGGVILTRDYADNRWAGASYITPGIIAESILNFGYFVGIPVGFFGLSAILFGVVLFYRRVLRALRSRRDLSAGTAALLYANVLVAAVSLLFGEFTNIVTSLMVTKIAPILLLVSLVKKFGFRRRSA